MIRYSLFFWTLFFTITFSASAQQAAFNGAESVLLKDGQRPDIARTMQIISEWRAQGVPPALISEKLNRAIPTSGTGIISGSLFQSDGITPLNTASQINVYDAYGFYEGSQYINPADTLYSVANLAAGMHYVQIYSYGNYLNTFYMDSEDWRQATLVQTYNDLITPDINFQLELGQVITGRVLSANSLDPLAGVYASFYLYEEDALHDQDYSRQFSNFISQDGSYYLSGIRPGNYKLKAFIDQYAASFYNNQSAFETADIIQVSAQTDTVKFINFIMNTIVAVQDGYEPNQEYEDAYPLSIGQTVTPQINPAGDLDFFTFTAGPADTLSFLIESQSIESQLYPYLSLYDSSGTYVLNNWISSDINAYQIMPYSGRYYLRVAHQSNQQGGEDFFYNLSINYYTPLTTSSASISGYVFLEDGITPYRGEGYYIQLLTSEGFYVNEYYFSDSVYVINQIPAGTYKMGIYASEQGFLREWYDNATSFMEATAIDLADQDSLTDINFVLDSGGAISGRIFLENYLSDFTMGGSVYLYDNETHNLSYNFGIASDPEGLFAIHDIRPGEYTLRFFPGFSNVAYPNVWYGDVGSQGQATPITVTAGETTDNITIIVKRGGLIQGLIKIAGDAMIPVSSDSLFVSVNVYDEFGFNASSARQDDTVVRLDNIADFVIGTTRPSNTFNGGYRTSLLYPGFYKLQVLPQISTLSSWYYSSGSHFDDPGSQMVEVKSDSAHVVPVSMNRSNGGISGIVYRADGSAPTNQSGIVYAYDASGHMVQSTVIGFDPQSGLMLDNGHYHIAGLIDGTYYLMFSFNSPMNNIRNIIVDAGQNSANIDRLIRPTAELRRNYTQTWYPDIVIENAFAEQLFFLPVPDGAVAVNVSASSVTDGINFNTPSAISAEDKTGVPVQFEISAVYPNPFNPVTTLTYNVPNRSRVQIDIFDILGQKVATVLDDIKAPGEHQIQWNGKNSYQQTVSSGIYIARLRAGAVQSSKKMLLIR